MSSDCLTQLREEVSHTDAFTEETPGVQQALLALETDLSSAIDQDLLARSLSAAAVRAAKRNERYDQTVGLINLRRQACLTLSNRYRQLSPLPRGPRRT